MEAWAATNGKATLLRAIAPSGTALTNNHATAISRMRAGEVILWPDGDAAGQAAGAAWRIQLAAAGIESDLLRLPADQDPLTCLAANRVDLPHGHKVPYGAHPIASIGPVI